MTTQPLSDAFEAGRRDGHEDGVQHPLTEAQELHVRTMLRQAAIDTEPAESRRKAS